MCSIFYSFYLSNRPLPKLPYSYNFTIHVLLPNHMYTSSKTVTYQLQLSFTEHYTDDTG